MKKENGSVAANISGFQGPLGGTPMIKRKLNQADSFENMVTQCEMNNMELEAVRKRGEDWVVFDDDTETQKGVFKDRKAAWAKQKQLRQAKKNSAKSSAKPKKAEKSHTASKPQTAPKAKLAPKSKKEHLMHMFKESVKRVLIEGSAISYVFEQDPVSKSSLFWNQLLEQMPKEVLLSDPTIKSIFHEMAKAEVDVLGRAFNATRRVLASGDFDVEKKDVDQDELGNLILNLGVSFEGIEDVPLVIKIENGKPLLSLPDEVEAGLNANPNEEIRKLKAFLAFVQEDQLDKMEDVSKLIQKRDEHLQQLLQKSDEVLMNLDPLKMSFVRFLLKTKYRGK